jgi:hypothetical protein
MDKTENIQWDLRKKASDSLEVLSGPFWRLTVRRAAHRNETNNILRAIEYDIKNI